MLQGVRQCFDAVTTNAAKVMHLEGYGIEPGCDASLVLMQTLDPMNVIRLRANRVKLRRKGKLLAETAEAVARIQIDARPTTVGLS